MPNFNVALGGTITVQANPIDAGGNPAQVFNGPQWNPTTNPSLVSLTPAVGGATCQIAGVAVGVATVTISGNAESNFGPLKTTDFTVTVLPGPLAGFNPTLVP